MSRPSVALLPQQQGVSFDETSHRYSVWSARRKRWMQPASTSQVLSRSGAKGFDEAHWRRSLEQQRGLRPVEATAYMELHRNFRADVGTDLHGLIRAELLGESFHPRHAEALMLLATWRALFLPRIDEVVVCEAPLASLAYFFTGTPDLVARMDGRWLVLDWKTKVSEAKAKAEISWRLQLAGYDLLIEEVHGLQLDGAMNLMIWSDGMKEVPYNRADLDQARALFLGHLGWSHAVAAADGDADHQGALEHLLRLHPGALERVEPPKELTSALRLAQTAAKDQISPN